MVISAKAAGLHAIDNVYTKLNRLSDTPEQKKVVEDGLREKNVQAAAIGMDGTWVVHPQQAKIANECFTPTREQIADAMRVVELYHAKGGGSMADPVSGDMIDEATIKVALMDLAKGLQNGDVDPEYLAEQASKSREVTGYDILNLVRRHS
jgi:citrate lyase beta subunit